MELGDKIQVVGELFYKYSKTKKEYVAVSHIMKANNLINITKKVQNIFILNEIK